MSSTSTSSAVDSSSSSVNGSSTPLSSSVTPTASNPFSFTPFTSPTFPQTTAPSGGNNGGNGNNSNNSNSGNTDLASSASLYLYTFLATLVLLLGVSAAIVIRSLLLRRRHRRMIEEAIRNGTYVPPTSGRGAKVDLSQKPRLFEAYLGLPPPSTEFGTGKEEYHLEWDGLLPVSASLTSSLQTHPSTLDNLASATSPMASSTPRLRMTLAQRARGLWHLISPHSNTSPNIDNSNNTSGGPNTNANVSATTPGTDPTSPTPQYQTLSSHPTAAPSSVRVSVLIAMPSQTPLEERLRQARQRGDDDEEEELPHLEVGVADVVVPAEVDGDVGVAAGVGVGGKGKEVEGRGSASSEIV